MFGCANLSLQSIQFESASYEEWLQTRENEKRNVCTSFRLFLCSLYKEYCQQICLLVAMLIRFFFTLTLRFPHWENVQIVRENKIELFRSIIICVMKKNMEHSIEFH